jgi:uncharacterized membrane-anchored protein
MNRTFDVIEPSFDVQGIPADVMKVRFDRTEIPADFTVFPADLLTIPTAVGPTRTLRLCVYAGGAMTDAARQTEAKAPRAADGSRDYLASKVPQVTVFFWIIKVLCTTVGETASDLLNIRMGFGLHGTSIAAGIALAVVLLLQFRAKKYVPGIYWLTVVLVSIFGTLITDILTDSVRFPLEASTVIFSVALGATFAVWYAKERTLSIHSIFTLRREAFYWLAILFTFALGTASGDLVAEKLGVGYLDTGLLVLAIIATTGIGWRLRLDPVLAFWIAYILTRPLGASVGDYLSQSRSDGGLGLGPTTTSVVFLSAILATVVYLAVSRRDLIPKERAAEEDEAEQKRRIHPMVQTAIAVAPVRCCWRLGLLLAQRPARKGSGCLRDARAAARRSIAVQGAREGHAGRRQIRRPGGRAGQGRRSGDRVGQRSSAHEAHEPRQVDDDGQCVRRRAHERAVIEGERCDAPVRVGRLDEGHRRAGPQGCTGSERQRRQRN